MSEVRLYHTLGEMIVALEDQDATRFEDLSLDFSGLETSTFGDFSERVRNDVAVTYDRIRNALTYYLGFILGEEMHDRYSGKLSMAKEMYGSLPVPC